MLNDDLAIKLKVVAVMASHKRPEITARSCRALQAMGCDVVLVVTEPSDVKALKEFNPVVYRNNPLGGKWQYGMLHAKERKADIVIICGSDDILCPDYLINAYKFLDKGFEFIGASQWYMDDIINKKKYKAWYKHLPDFPIGSGRVFTKKALDGISWKVFDTQAEKRLDDLAIKRLCVKKYISVNIEKDGLIVTAIKGDWSMLNPLERFKTAKSIGLKQM